MHNKLPPLPSQYVKATDQILHALPVFCGILLIFSLPAKYIADTHIHKQSETVYIISTTNFTCLQETYPHTTACNIRLVGLPGQSSSCKISYFGQVLMGEA